jgi:oligopeptide transport system ATP-binding protein
MQDNILEVKNLKIYFPIKGKIIPKVVGNVKAVDGISFSIKPGQTLGLVGESGCGKSTTARGILKLIEPKSGEVIFEGKDILKFNKKEVRLMRKKMQIIFQDPFASLNPKMSVGDALKEVLYVHQIGNPKDRTKLVEENFERVGLNKKYLSRFPHEFSGGQRQRIVFARALVLNPKLIICDEPVSALDVSIQAQVINLMEELKEELKLTYLFIAHDLSVVKHISDRVAVMYLGKIVEIADKDELFNNPQHPYTKALFSAIPICDPEHKSERIILDGDMPSPINPPSGCSFHTRCYKAQEICKNEVPEEADLGGDHLVSCHFCK